MAQTITEKRYMIKDTIVTEDGHPDKHDGWGTFEVPMADAISNVDTATDATAAKNATAINNILAALRAAGIVATT